MIANMLALAAALWAVAEPPPPEAEPKVVVCFEKPQEIKTVDDLLNLLERADHNLRALGADIEYERVFGVMGDRQVRTGALTYADERPRGAEGQPIAKGPRRFAIHFTRLRHDDRVEEQNKTIVFDGEWLIEKLPDEKQFIKRRVVAPGQEFDPLKIGEGPLPLPIGQKKSDILARYDAEMPEVTDGITDDDAKRTEDLKKFVEGSFQLKLTPKGNWKELDDFEEVRLWYRQVEGAVTLQPRMARTINKAGDVSVVRLINLKINEPVPSGVLDVTPPGSDWDVRIEELNQGERR
jgi:hypothetical protein